MRLALGGASLHIAPWRPAGYPRRPSYERPTSCARISRRSPPVSSSPSDCSGGVFDWDAALRRLDELNARVEDPKLWDDSDAAQTLMRERTALATQVERVQRLERELKDDIELAEMAQDDGDETTLDEIVGQLRTLKDIAAKAELEALLSGEADGADAYLEVNSGAG